MTTIKSYTDIEQSKKLAEILPLESADMLYYCSKESNALISESPFVRSFKETNTFSYVPCWSLTTLLSILPDSIYNNTNEFSQLEFTKKSVAYIHGTTGGIKIGALKDNLIDTCYELILKLNELNLL